MCNSFFCVAITLTCWSLLPWLPNEHTEKEASDLCPPVLFFFFISRFWRHLLPDTSFLKRASPLAQIVPPAALLTTLFTLPPLPSCLLCCLIFAPVPPLCQRSSAPTSYLQTVWLTDEINPVTDHLHFCRSLKHHLKKKKKNLLLR